MTAGGIGQVSDSNRDAKQVVATMASATGDLIAQSEQLSAAMASFLQKVRAA